MPFFSSVSRAVIHFSVFLAFIFAFMPGASHAASACTHYASPTGTGNGSSASQPFKISNFWPLAQAGHTLCLLNGQYTGSASMINPPQNLHGTASAPITVRALNDGKVTIDGQGSLSPVLLSYNNYFVLEGFNAHHSKTSMVSLSNSNHNIVRRIAAWDAADGNHVIFGVHHGSHNLLEDVAGWGIARKIFSASQGGDFTTIRRAWGRWEGSHVVGPKITYEMAYNNFDMICENCLGTWSGERMQETYVLMGYDGKPWTGSGGGIKTNYAVDQAYGIFVTGNTSGMGGRAANSKILGSIGYPLSARPWPGAWIVFVSHLDGFEVANTVAYFEPDTNLTKKRFDLRNRMTAPGTSLIARNLTGIGGSTSSYGSDWQKSFISEGPTLGSVNNVFKGTGAANVCYRYKDGVLTNEPLWPWPMNQRIINAMVESGRASVDVTNTIENMLGPIPASCTSIPTASVPTAPVNLQVGS